MCFLGDAQSANLDVLRQKVAQAHSRRETLRGQRQSLEKSLEQLANKIEQEKKSRGSNWFVHSDLYRLLEKSQEISSQIIKLVRAENHVLGELKAHKEELAEQLGIELEEYRKQLKQVAGQAIDQTQTANQERWRLLSQIRVLSAEQSKMLEAIAAVPTEPLVVVKSEDDPEKLKELADAFLDYEDKLRREEQLLSQRIEVLENERDLERRMGELVEEDSLWGENDRRIAIHQQHLAASSPNEQADQRNAENADAPVSAENTDNQETAVSKEKSPDQAPTTYSPTANTGNAEGQKHLVNVPSGVSNTWIPFSDNETIEQLINRRARVHQLAAEARIKAKEIRSKAQALRSHE
jgi:hypothetical protein